MAGKRRAATKKATGKKGKAKKKSGGKKRTPPKGGKKDPRRLLSIGLKRPVRPEAVPRLPLDPWRPPTPNGHFDRLFFSLCSNDHQLLKIDGYVQDFASPNQYPFSHGANPPMSNSEILVAAAQTQFVSAVATLDFLGTLVHVEFHADIVAASGNPNELIECLVCGVAVHDLNGQPNLRPYAVLFGDSGASFALPDPLIFVY